MYAYDSAWGFGFTEDFRTSPLSPLQQIQPLLDDPNLVMLFVNQHHNVSHPKVISVPRYTNPFPTYVLIYCY